MEKDHDQCSGRDPAQKEGQTNKIIGDFFSFFKIKDVDFIDGRPLLTASVCVSVKSVGGKGGGAGSRSLLPQGIASSRGRPRLQCLHSYPNPREAGPPRRIPRCVEESAIVDKGSRV
jgi:hypothetical protein